MRSRALGIGLGIGLLGARPGSGFEPALPEDLCRQELSRALSTKRLGQRYWEAFQEVEQELFQSMAMGAQPVGLPQRTEWLEIRRRVLASGVYQYLEPGLPPRAKIQEFLSDCMTSGRCPRIHDSEWVPGDVGEPKRLPAFQELSAGTQEALEAWRLQVGDCPPRGRELLPTRAPRPNPTPKFPVPRPPRPTRFPRPPLPLPRQGQSPELDALERDLRQAERDLNWLEAFPPPSGRD